MLGLLAISLILTGCQPEAVEEQSIVEQNEDLVSKMQSDEEIVVVIDVSPDEVVVYEKEIELKKRFNVDSVGLTTGYIEVGERLGDLPFLEYIRFSNIGITEEYPQVKFKFVSENPFIVYFMQNEYSSLEKKYIKKYGVSYLDSGAIPRTIRNPWYIADWLRDYTISDCPQVDFKYPYPQKVGDLYVLEGSCLVYNPNWQTQGIMIWNMWDWDFSSDKSDHNKDIVVDVTLTKKKGDLPVTFEEEFIHEEIIQHCPPKTEKCEQKWFYHQKEVQKIYDDNYNILGELHRYTCNGYFDPKDEQVYTVETWCWEKQEICNDYKDNDDDKLMDCQDPNCSEDVYCK